MPQTSRWCCARQPNLLSRTTHRRSPTWTVTQRAERWLADRKLASRMEWAVEETAGNVVGRVCLCAIDDESAVAEVGYWLFTSARGKGLATIVVNAVAAWAFDEGGFGRLAIEHELDNTASCRVAERCGFAFEAVKRGAIVVRGGRHDVHVHARLATD